jgi:hypothetical protein
MIKANVRLRAFANGNRLLGATGTDRPGDAHMMRTALVSLFAIALTLGVGCNREPSSPSGPDPGIVPIPPDDFYVAEVGRSAVTASDGDLLLPTRVVVEFADDRYISRSLHFIGVAIRESGHEVFTHADLMVFDINRNDGLDTFFHGFELGGHLFVAGFLGAALHGLDAPAGHDDESLVMKLAGDEWEYAARFDCTALDLASVVPVDSDSVLIVGTCGNQRRFLQHRSAISIQRFDGRELYPIDHSLRGELVGAAKSGDHVYIATTTNVQAYSTITGAWTDLGHVDSDSPSARRIRDITSYDGGVVIGGTFTSFETVAGFTNVAKLRVGAPPEPLGGIPPHEDSLMEKIEGYAPVEALCVLSDGRLVAGGANPMRLAVFDPTTRQWGSLTGDFEAFGQNDWQMDLADVTMSDFSVITRVFAAPNTPAVLLHGAGMPQGEVIEVPPGQTRSIRGLSVGSSSAPTRVSPHKLPLTTVMRYANNE